MMFAQLPNFLTLLRIAMVPVVVVLLGDRQYEAALFVFVLAGITDGLDGWIAKRYHLQSAFGAMLDPIADKLLLVSTYTMLTFLGDIPFWLLVIVLFRDFLIVGGYWFLIAMQTAPKVKPIITSKINTFMQIILVVMVLLSKAEYLTLTPILPSMFIAVFASTVISGLGYLFGNLGQFYNKNDPRV